MRGLARVLGILCFFNGIVFAYGTNATKLSCLPREGGDPSQIEPRCVVEMDSRLRGKGSPQLLNFMPSGAINPLDKRSVARGAYFFMAYCSGCHTLRYTRYSPMLMELKLLQFANGDIHNAASNAPVKTSMPPKDAYQWFGQVPPDLSLIAKTRGSQWLYQYLTSFYPDAHQPYGENNKLIPNVRMPNPFSMQSGDSFDGQPVTTSQMVTDIVTFLTYVSDPSVTLRHKIAPFVLLICFVLLMLVYGLKHLYWKKVHSAQASLDKYDHLNE